MILYAAIGGSFTILVIFHILRFILGTQFSNLSILNSQTATVFGSWSSLGVFSTLVAIISICALTFLPLARKSQIYYWVLAIVATFFGLITNVYWSLIFAGVLLLILVAFRAFRNQVDENGIKKSFIKRIPLVPLIFGLIFILSVFVGGTQINNVAIKLGTSYQELSLPWQMTLDIGLASAKDTPVFGVGPNHFTQAFLWHKPIIINTTDLWGVEFANGSGYIPTFFITQGIVGIILWLLLFILLIWSGNKTLRKLPSDRYTQFIIISSYLGMVFAWLTMLVYIPSHALLSTFFIVTGLYLGTAVAYGCMSEINITSESMGLLRKLLSPIAIILIIVCILWGVIYIKKTIALAYFGAGIKHLTQENNIVAAEKSFINATTIDSSDIYWQARAETELFKVRQLATQASQSTTSPKDVATNIQAMLAKADEYAKTAIKYDPNNYYNYISEARVFETAMNFDPVQAYQNTVDAYTNATKLNPYNPSLYLNVARIQASQKKFDDALNSLASALKIKPNYSDAAFMATQIAVAQGKINEALVAAKATAEFSPASPLAHFTVGLIAYNLKDYALTIQAMSKAIELQPDYANAQYFLGLSYARIGNTKDALTQFEKLALTNPDNQEVAFIVTNLKEGRSPFADAKPPITPTPEKRPSLPIPEKKK